MIKKTNLSIVIPPYEENELIKENEKLKIKEN